MTDKVLLDTNLWVYLYSKEPYEKYQRVEQILRDRPQSIQISTQVLGELFHVLTRKKFTSEADAVAIVSSLINSFPILPIESANVLQAMEVKQKYGYTYWDSLVLATALLHNCSILYSEDMQHGQFINSTLRIVNPFA
jgi:predicted nucleic acid-binding protein